MRVITGEARGRRLKEPTGQDIRPTTDKVKEGMFNIIQGDIEGRQVLDLFAGTGQLGIEALSRGAAAVTFVEKDPKAMKLVKENLAITKLDGGRVIQGEALSFLAGPEKYDLIFLDPPYDTNLLENAILRILQFDKLNLHGIMVCESKVEKQLPEAVAPYVKGREYRYGSMKLTIYTRKGQDQ